MSTYPPDEGGSPSDDNTSSQLPEGEAEEYTGTRYGDTPTNNDPYVGGGGGDPYGDPQGSDPHSGGYGSSSDPYAAQQNPGGYPPPPPNAPVHQGGPGYGQAPEDPDAANRITLNFWLSAFFTWIPALIFYLTESNKTSRAMEYHKANLNFSLLRLFVALFTVIPFVGWILGGIASIVLFVIQIMAAINAPNAYRAGEPTYKYPFNIPLIK